MANPLLTELKSVLVFEEVTGITGQYAPTLDADRQIAVDAVSQTVVNSVDLDDTTDADYVWNVFEALDGNVKRQLNLVKSFTAATDNATVTQYFEASPTVATIRNWQLPWPIATVTTANAAGTHVVSTLRTEADDYWNQYKMFCFSGDNNTGDLLAINDFWTGNDTFEVATATGAWAVGDACIPVQPIQPADVEIVVSGGVPIERTIITDTLAKEGVVVGAQDEVTMSISPEIRPLATAAGDGVTAQHPCEAHVFLKTVFDSNLDTGDAVDTTNGTTNTTQIVCAEAASTFTQYNLAMVNGDVFAIGAVADATPAAGDSQISGIPAGHISSDPQDADVVYAGACYRPQDTGHSSIGALCYMGDSELIALTGGMAEVGIEVNNNEIAKYKFNYSFAGGLLATESKNHDDVYDTTAPLVGKANVSRVVLGGSELVGDVLNISATLQPAPQKRTTAFQAFENNGGMFYTTRDGTVSMTVYLEDSNYWQQYRANTEFDLLVQVGSSPAGAWGLWCPRVQLVEAPTMGDENGLMTWSLSFRILRPTTAGQPDWVLGVF